MIVDGASIGDEQNVVIRDRQMLTQDGMFVIANSHWREDEQANYANLQILFPGFVYLKENQELLRQTRMIIKKIVEDGKYSVNPANFDNLKIAIAEQMERFLFKTAKVRWLYQYYSVSRSKSADGRFWS